MQDNPLREGLGVARKPAPFVLTIFGATGDLTRRKLIPALYTLFTGGFLDDFRIVGYSRRQWTDADFRRHVGDALHAALPQPPQESLLADFLQRLSFTSGAYDDAEALGALATHRSRTPNMLHYLATPPEAYMPIVRALGVAGLADQSGGSARLIIEKPFGHNLETAQELNAELISVFKEAQVFRIDHYLGKETVQNLMVLRFGNGIFEPIWNHQFVESVQITVAETLGIEGRGAYYDHSGAMRDIIQNHGLQLLALVAMEPPNDLLADSIRDEKVKVLRALQPIAADNVAAATVRGQYTAGVVGGADVPGYLQEEGVAGDSHTETYAALKVGLRSWRWSGVPFYLRTGKRLARRLTEITVRFKDAPHRLFAERRATSYAVHTPNSLVIRIQPDEGAALVVNFKVPGQEQLRPVSLDFSYGAGFSDRLPDAYERLLLDAMVGDGTLYTRRDEIEAAWRFVDGVLGAWEAADMPVADYRAGSSGPEAAVELAGGAWRKL